MIDHIYTSNPGSYLESGCLDAGVSDHLMVFTVRMGGQSMVIELRMLECLRDVMLKLC